MKHSIRTKITFLLTIMVVLTIFITWFINRTFLSDFYYTVKTNRLIDASREVSEIYQKNGEDYLSEDNINLMERLESKYDVKVYVISSKYYLIYPNPVNIGEREKTKIEDIVKGLFGFMNPFQQNLKVRKRTPNYDIITYYNKQMNSNIMELDGIVTFPSKTSSDTSNNSTGNSSDTSQDNSNVSGDKTDNSKSSSPIKTGDNKAFVAIQSNLESISTGVAIANEFLAYVGIIAALIGSIAMFLISKKFTRPILDLAGIAKKMTDLNFEVKYKVNSKDEIGELGNSINSLSDKLESTIVELKQANNELLTDIQRKTEIDEMRKEFLSNVSHELKTPIALIQGYAEGLQENINDDEESREYYCEVIIDEANKMNNMVKKLLSLNELEFGNNKVNFDRFDIVSLIKSVLGSTEILFKQKDVTLLFENTEPIYVWADELLIEQVVTNYISNALNHVDGQKIIEIKLISRESTVRVAVFNTGENIPEEELDKLWIKFYKVDKARTREYGGSGIGLSIVKAIMNSHNKECGVFNRPIGVEFWFELDTKS